MALMDRIFKAHDIRGTYADEIDEDLAWKVGHASAQFLRSLLSGYERGLASSNRLVVGRDMRPHSESLCHALIEGVTATGAGCMDVGLCDTPMIYFAVNHLGTCGGVQVTASASPIELNGFKIAGAKARCVGQRTGLVEVRHIVSTLRRMPEAASFAPVQKVDLWNDYRKHVLRFFRPSRRLKVVVDASNGMGGKMIPAIFDQADVEIFPLNFQTGPDFAHPPDPMDEANLLELKAAVKKRKADMGLCLDGDADRCTFLDEKGRAIRSDVVTAIFATHFLKDNPGATVVYDLRCSRAVAEEIRAAGGVPRRERVGCASMKKAMADGHGLFGGDLNGSFYFRDNYTCESAAIAFATALTVFSAHDEPVSELVAPIQRYSHSGPIYFVADDQDAKLDKLAETFSDAKIDYLDGVTCQYKDWWCNVRPSDTEALLCLNLEARDKAAVKQRLRKVKEILGRPVRR